VSKCRPDNVDEVVTYFFIIGSDKDAANWFYDHFESNGWRVGGRSPMKNWEAAARNWVRKTKQWKQASEAQRGTSKLARMKAAFEREAH